jgi:hypothetical protein
MTSAVPIDAPRPSEADQLEAPGVFITLVNGKKARLRYGARAIRYLEKQWDGLPGFQEAMTSPKSQIGAFYDALYAGLLHEQLAGNPDDVLDMLDERRMATEYLKAFEEAFAQSVPTEAQENQNQPKPRVLSENFLGPNSNTLPEPNSESPLKTSSGG